MEIQKVLIIDDSSIMRRVIKNLLQSYNDLEICGEARNGEEGLSLLQTLKPDLILLDVEMPKMNGIEFLRHAKLRSQAKIIVLSSVTDFGSDRAKEAIQNGAHAIVSKPSGAISLDLEKACGEQLYLIVKSIVEVHQ